jgi:capsular polysaccharide export protein
MARLRPGLTLLPPPVQGWPAVLRVGAGQAAPAAADAALARVRVQALWWPAPRAGAGAPRAAAFGPAAAAAARAAFPADAVTVVRNPAEIAPDRLEAVYGAPADAALWAAVGGVAVMGAGVGSPDPPADPRALLAAAAARCPWTGASLPLESAVDAQALLRAAALRARGPARLVAMSPWKRGCLRPFLTGPDGPPRAARDMTAARRRGGPAVVWGGAADADLGVEDGFLRSVGLGLRHAPPVSLILRPGRLHFDATGPNGFEALVAAAAFPPALLARAARLRARVLALRLTKYNAGAAAPLPTPPPGRERVLVPGQVESDASIRLGATTVRDNESLLRAARARFPNAFILYKHHPDVLTGWRPGEAGREALAWADAVVEGGDAAACLDWADRVATITSLMGFEALLRGRAVTTFGRPFYAGWGLTDDADPPPRPRALDLDQLTAAALILYPDYVDPATGLPAPPEIAIEALARARAGAGRPRARLVAAWRLLASWALNGFPRSRRRDG